MGAFSAKFQTHSTVYHLYFSRETREFFCLDDPPGPFDSLEESRVCIFD
jgi:hypothetical protein